MTSRLALLRFLAVQQDAASAASATSPRSFAARRRADAQAEAELTKLGI
jgi:hypothetical protein